MPLKLERFQRTPQQKNNTNILRVSKTKEEKHYIKSSSKCLSPVLKTFSKGISHVKLAINTGCWLILKVFRFVFLKF